MDKKPPDLVQNNNSCNIFTKTLKGEEKPNEFCRG